MRLQSLELSGFRGFPQRHTFDLNADAVVVVGANGNGKTSLFDGILWALSGRIPRLHNDDARLVSMYSEAGQARVALRLEDPVTGRQLTVTRSFDGTEGRVALETPDGTYQGPSAEGRLIDLIWREAASASDPREALASVLTRSVYLQQDLIRQFVEAESDQERFAAVSELVGAGRVTELQASLERAKKAWSTATNQRQDELRPLGERLAGIEGRLSELTARASQAAPAITPEAWDQWWQGLAALGLSAAPAEQASREAPAAIDNAIKQLDAFRRSTERRFQALRLVQTEIAGLATRPMPEIRPLSDSVIALRKQLEDVKRVVTEEQTRLAELRRRQAALGEKIEQLKTLASLALRHLEDRCPVCAQTYDKEATRRRLEAMAKGGIGDVQTASGPDKLPQLLAALAAKEKEAGAAEVALRSAEQAVNERQMAQQTLSARVSELGVTATDDPGRATAVAEAIAEVEASIRRLAEFQRMGESLALRLSQSSALAAIEELRFEADTLRRETADREKAIAARSQTGERAQRVIEALREAASAVVQERLREIGPLLQSIYARIDPHPTFRMVTFLSRVVRGRGQLSTVVSDPIEEKACDLPAAVLSSSQVNALAVCVFLALNIGVPKPPLSVAILDDPLQSLDDINLLGLLDLLRRAKDRRQLLVSTHDVRFGSLLSRKLRPSNQQGRTIVIELNGWSRLGPIVVTREVKSDPVPLRLVASGAG
jgi:DNA repair exonuclease SbcCD ATPase subunit